MNQLSFFDDNLLFALPGGRVVAPAEWQLQLKPGDYYLIERPILRIVNPAGQVERTEGPAVYGQIVTNQPHPKEPVYKPGYFLVRAYSTWCPDGELGTFHISEATRPLTAAEFEAARAASWPDSPPLLPGEGLGVRSEGGEGQ